MSLQGYHFIFMGDNSEEQLLDIFFRSFTFYSSFHIVFCNAYINLCHYPQILGFSFLHILNKHLFDMLGFFFDTHHCNGLDNLSKLFIPYFQTCSHHFKLSHNRAILFFLLNIGGTLEVNV